MEKSEKWAGRPLWGSGNGEFEEIWRNRRNGLVDHGGREVESSKKYEEIGEMGWPTTGGDQEIENSRKYGEIGTIE